MLSGDPTGRIGGTVGNSAGVGRPHGIALVFACESGSLLLLPPPPSCGRTIDEARQQPGDDATPSGDGRLHALHTLSLRQLNTIPTSPRSLRGRRDAAQSGRPPPPPHSRSSRLRWPRRGHRLADAASSDLSANVAQDRINAEGEPLERCGTHRDNDRFPAPRQAPTIPKTDQGRTDG